MIFCQKCENKQLHFDFIILDGDDPIYRPHFSHWFLEQTRSSQPQAKGKGNWCARSPGPGNRTVRVACRLSVFCTKYFENILRKELIFCTKDRHSTSDVSCSVHAPTEKSLLQNANCRMKTEMERKR